MNEANDLDETNDFYPCAGICRVDPESGYCIGCGRPTFPPNTSDPEPIAEAAKEEPSSAESIRA